VDQNSVEKFFERNADMRLLELRHNDIGMLPAAARRGASFAADAIVSTTYEDLVIDAAPRLRVTLSAVPASGVIPGAVVAVAVDVHNDGAAPAPESRLVFALPHDSEYRPGSLRVDGREVTAGEQLFGSGLSLARIPGASSTKVTLQFVVRPGITALHLQPQLEAGGAPIVGAAALAIRRAASGTPPAFPAGRPFYELEDGEIDADVAAQTQPELPPVLPPVEAAPVRPAPKSLTPRFTAPLAARRAAPGTPWPKIAPPAAEPSEPEPMPEPAPVAAQPVMPRYRTIVPADLVLAERLFTAPVPGIVAHGVLISSIACFEGAEAGGGAAFAAFLRRDIAASARALVLTRLGKAPDAPLTQTDLDGLALPWAPSAGAPDPAPGTFRLRRDLSRTEHAAVGGLLQPSERAASFRLRTALLALAGATVEGSIEPQPAAAAATALAAYRSLALAWLVPLCVASAGEETPVAKPPAAAGDAGRRVIAALRAIVGG
jgi:hypothetical protein